MTSNTVVALLVVLVAVASTSICIYLSTALTPPSQERCERTIPLHTTVQSNNKDEPLRQQHQTSSSRAEIDPSIRKPTIDQLARVWEHEYNCPEGQVAIHSLPNVTALGDTSHYTIPLIIHQTCKTHCISPEVHKWVSQWQAVQLPYYLHDDASMEALILSDASLAFPHLRTIWDNCLNHMPAAKTDLWRMLLLWTYGGIYADIDTRPTKHFHPFKHISPIDEFYALTDNEGLASFHFFAARPKHPMLFLIIHHGLKNIITLGDTGSFNPARFTGPKAMQQAMRSFLEGTVDMNNTMHNHITSNGENNFTFVGLQGATIRREGPKEVANKIVNENALGPDKGKKYEEFDMKHYYDSTKSNKTCLGALLELASAES